MGLEKTTMFEKKIHLADKFDYTEVEKDKLIESFGRLKDLSGKIRAGILQNVKLKNLIKNYPSLDIPAGEDLSQFDLLYNFIFDSSINSRWVRISYIKAKFAEFPYINVRTQQDLFPKRVEIAMAVIFPVGISVLTVNVLRKFYFARKLALIERLSQSIIKGLNNPSLISELDSQL
jgi:hypothetical protein